MASKKNSPGRKKKKRKNSQRIANPPTSCSAGLGSMFNGMMDPEMMKMAQEQMNETEMLLLVMIHMMSNPELIRMASESMQSLRPEDFMYAADRLKHTHPEEMAEIGERIARTSPDERASMRARMDAQVSYEINAAEMLKKQGNELHSQGKYQAALEKYSRAKNDLKEVPTSTSRNILLACSLNMMSCYLKTKQYYDCIREGTEVLANDVKNVKALYRRGQAHKELGQLGDAVSDLRKALEVSPGDKTIAKALRDAEERLTKEGDKHPSRVIEEITEEVSVSSEKHENPALTQQEAHQGNTSQIEKLQKPRSNTEYLDALKDDPESIRSFQSFISQTDPETLSAINGGKVEDLSPGMVKTAANVIGKMSPEELQRMFQLASSFQGDHAYTKTGSPFSAGSVPPNLSPEMLSTATDMMSKLSSEELQKMFDMVSSLKGNEGSPSSSTALHSYPGSVPPNVSTEMIKMATDMMSKMSEEHKKMFEIASSLGGQDRPSSTADLSTTRENFTVNDNHVDESSSSQGLHSGNTPQSSFLGSTADLQEQMKDSAMCQMLTSMMKNMSPEMMANMSQQFGFKLSHEDAERAQQAMSSLSPDTLDTMMKWANRIKRGVEGARKTKNWLLGRPGMILAVFMLLLAVILNRFGFIGRPICVKIFESSFSTIKTLAQLNESSAHIFGWFLA